MTNPTPRSDRRGVVGGRCAPCGEIRLFAAEWLLAVAAAALVGVFPFPLCRAGWAPPLSLLSECGAVGDAFGAGALALWCWCSRHVLSCTK